MVVIASMAVPTIIIIMVHRIQVLFYHTISLIDNPSSFLLVINHYYVHSFRDIRGG